MGNYIYRTIRPEEAGQAAEIEQICFPPNEACAWDKMIERVQAAPELFLVAVDAGNSGSGELVGGKNTDGKNAGEKIPGGKYIDGKNTDEENMSGKFGDGRIVGCLNGLATDETTFRDEFFTNAGLFQPDGKNIMLLGLAVLPEYRHQGIAGELVRRYAEREREKGRESLILTCLQEKVAMYEKMGFEDCGIAGSSWGGEEWHEMRMRLRR